MAGVLSPLAFAESLVGEFAAALGAIVGEAAASPAASAPEGPGWRLSATASGELGGSIDAWVDDAGAIALARAMMGGDEAPEPATLADMLKEMWAQAAGALSLVDPFTRVKTTLAAVAAGDAPPPIVAVDLRFAEMTVRVAVGGALEAQAMAAPAPAASATAPAADTGAASAVPSDKLDSVLDVELPLVVRFARTVLPLKVLAALGPGSIVDMERSPDEPVQLLVGERLIARGEVVVVSGNYGVRVTELVGPGERARAMEG